MKKLGVQIAFGTYIKFPMEGKEVYSNLYATQINANIDTIIINAPWSESVNATPLNPPTKAQSAIMTPTIRILVVKSKFEFVSSIRPTPVNCTEVYGINANKDIIAAIFDVFLPYLSSSNPEGDTIPFSLAIFHIFGP